MAGRKIFSKLTTGEKWTVLGAAIGIVVGIATTLLYYAIQFVTNIFLGDVAGFQIPLALGEGGSLGYILQNHIYFLLPVAIIVGAVLSGLIVYKLAPETEGHGTDAVIRAYHDENGRVRTRVPFIKFISSALLIGSGGSGGREGPTAQVSAGIGSIIAKHLDISQSDKRTITAIALGAGIGTMFKAPFGGALLAGEILYKHDMEVEAIPPAVIASIVGFTIFGSFVGFNPIFGTVASNFIFNYSILPFFAIIGVVTGLFARLYVKVFYYVHGLFRKLRTTNWLKPAIGAAFTGVVALAFPEVVGVGYGWIQLMTSGGFFGFTNTYGMPLAVFFIVIALAKMFATSTSIASGGSGGVFAPGMFIGCSVGIATTLLMGMAFPTLLTPTMIGAMAIIGMLSFFGAAGKVSIAVTVMVIEMTGSLALLPAGMFAIALSRIVAGEESIYISQLDTRRDSPAHIRDYYTPLLKKVMVRNVLSKGTVLNPDLPVYKAEEIMGEDELASAPVVSRSGRFIGAVYKDTIINMDERGKRAGVGRFARKVRYAEPGNTALKAWNAMVKNKASWCAVVERGKYVGVVKMRHVFRKYSQKI